MQLGHDAVREHFRLSCQTKLIESCTVLIAPPKSEVGHQILGATGRVQGGAGAALDSGVEKHVIAATPAMGRDSGTPDAEIVLASLKANCRAAFPLEILRRMPQAMRAKDGLLTVTTFNGEVIDIEAGDTSAQKYGMAFDIGTSTIVASLLDLNTGEQLAAVSDVNPQATYGGDVMSRIAFAQFNQKNFATLRAKVLNAVNEMVAQTCHQGQIDARHIYKLVMVGNTCMHHMLLGIDTSYLGMAPYTPVVRESMILAAEDLP